MQVAHPQTIRQKVAGDVAVTRVKREWRAAFHIHARHFEQLNVVMRRLVRWRVIGTVLEVERLCFRRADLVYESVVLVVDGSPSPVAFGSVSSSGLPSPISRAAGAGLSRVASNATFQALWTFSLTAY